MARHSPRAFPLGEAPPVGARQGTGKYGYSARGRRPRLRICLRKGCRRWYQPRRWNQRYCQDPECRRLIRRWLAAQRQARHRQDIFAKARHAQAEKARRQRIKTASQAVEKSKVTPARGHTAENFFPAPLQSTWLSRTPRALDPQPRTLLLPRLPSGRSQCPGSGTQVAFSRHLGWP
jgi:hypothetical protein